MNDELKTKIITSLKIFYKSWFFSIIVAMLIAFSFKSAIADWNEVPTGSMKPTIIEGDRIFVNKLAYDLKFPLTTFHLATWADPERGDIVVFYSPADGKRLVKRIIGKPGDTIAMIDNTIFINGSPLHYAPLSDEILQHVPEGITKHATLLEEDLSGREHPVMIDRVSPSIRSFPPVTIPERNYFVMGDNRDNSADSRYFGFVPRSNIVGRASAVVISLNYNNYYIPRWDRSFTPLP